MSNNYEKQELKLLIQHLRAFEQNQNVSSKLTNLEVIKRQRIDAYFGLEYFKDNAAEDLYQSLELRKNKRQFKSLKMLKTIKLLADSFSEYNVDFQILKGFPLNSLLFGNSIRRVSRDIDVLIKKSNVKAAFSILQANGFSLISPEFEIKEEQWSLFIEEMDQAIFVDPKTNICIEIHWKLFRNEAFFETGEPFIWLNAKKVKIGNIEVLTLKNALHAVYVSLHGAQHQWDSLIWIADMYKFSQKLTEEELKESIQIAKKYNVLEAYILGYYMADLIFKMNLPKFIKNEITEEVRVMAHKSFSFLNRLTSTADGSSEVLKRMYYAIRLQNSFKGKIHHFYNFPIYSFKHKNSRRKFVHWSLRPITQLKEKRFKNKN